MKFKLFKNQVVAIAKSNTSPVVVLQHGGNTFSLTVTSDGKAVYTDGTYKTSFSIFNCNKYFRKHDYMINGVFMQDEDIDDMDEIIVLTMFGDQQIMNHRNEAHENKSAFSLDEECSENEDGSTYEDCMADPNGISPEEVYVLLENADENELARAIVNSEIAKLTFNQQIVIKKMFFENKKGVQIAKELNIHATSVRDRKKAAFKSLRKSKALKDIYEKICGAK